MNTLKDRVVLLLGLGASGLAMARWCARNGATVRVWDTRESPPLAPALHSEVPGAVWVRGALDGESLSGVHRVLKSPGLSPADPRLRDLLGLAQQRGVPVSGELDLFTQALQALRAERGYAPRLLAVTGTNGKTTTTSMAALLIQRTGRRVAVAGNIGPTMLQTLADALDLEPPPAPRLGEGAPSHAEALRDGALERHEEGHGEDHEAALCGPRPDTCPDTPCDVAGDASIPTDDGEPADTLARATDVAAPAPAAPVFVHLPEVWVLELSSFQLHDAHGFEPDAAVVLNVTQDHLDWHGSMAAYAAAKARIFGTRGVIVVNRDDPLVEAMVPAPQVVKRPGSRRAVTVHRRVVRFGLGAPQHPGDFGLVEDHGMAWLVRARELDETLTRARGGKGAGVAALEDISIQRLMPADALRVRGRHNAANALAALALATAVDCPMAPMLHGLREYAGEPHRVQYIASLDGVDAFDDSKGTNVGATVAALVGLGADRSPGKLVLILGGDGKGQDFAPLIEPVRRYVRAVALLGQDAVAIGRTLAASEVPVHHVQTLQAATRWCFEQARSGDAVLLSPACSSLDMFTDYAHRADVFVAEVRSVVSDRGGVA